MRIRSYPESLCPACGSNLARISRKRAFGLVPETSYKRYRAFYYCGKCKKAYWHGTHWKRIRKRLVDAKKISGRMKARSASPPAPRPR